VQATDSGKNFECLQGSILLFVAVYITPNIHPEALPFVQTFSWAYITSTTAERHGSVVLFIT
jgi:hypothetical protein